MSTTKKTEEKPKEIPKKEMTFSGHILCNGYTQDGKNVHGFLNIDPAGALTLEEIRQSFNAAMVEKPNVVPDGFRVTVIED